MNKTSKEIRKELAILIKENLKNCNSKKERNIAIETARQQINIKYGKWGSEKDLFESYDSKYKYHKK